MNVRITYLRLVRQIHCSQKDNLKIKAMLSSIFRLDETGTERKVELNGIISLFRVFEILGLRSIPRISI